MAKTKAEGKKRGTAGRIAEINEELAAMADDEERALDEELAAMEPGEEVDEEPRRLFDPESEAAGETRIVIDTDELERGEELRRQGLPYPMPKKLGGGSLVVQPTWAPFVAKVRTKWDEWLRRQSVVREMLQARKTSELYGAPLDELLRKVYLSCIVGWINGPILIIDGEKHDTREMDARQLRHAVEQRYLRRVPLGETDVSRHMFMPFFRKLAEAVALCDAADAAEISRLGKDFVLGDSEPSIEDD